LQAFQLCKSYLPWPVNGVRVFAPIDITINITISISEGKEKQSFISLAAER